MRSAGGATAYEIVARGDVELRWEDAPDPEPRLAAREREVERIWTDAVRESGGRLFNGTLPDLVSIERRASLTVLTGRFVEYRYYYAQWRRPGLDLGIRPIGVSGVTTFDEHSGEQVVFARRARHTTQYAGMLEVVPSGTIDRSAARSDGTIDFRAKLLEEFTEETGVDAGVVASTEVLGVVMDRRDRSHDVCCLLRARVERATLLEAMARSDEYDEPVIVPRADLAAFVKARADGLVPMSLGICELLAEERA